MSRKSLTRKICTWLLLIAVVAAQTGGTVWATEAAPAAVEETEAVEEADTKEEIVQTEVEETETQIKEETEKETQKETEKETIAQTEENKTETEIETEKPASIDFFYNAQILMVNAKSANTGNEKIIYKYLTEVMEFNSAVACGILANIEVESNFNPNCSGDSGSSYGICQWHEIRFKQLKDYCPNNWQTLEGQLDFLNYELTSQYPSLVKKLREVPNSSYGAYLAGYAWCYDFERPANYSSVSITRGKLAQNTYWPKYAGDSTAAGEETINIVSYTVPGTLQEGTLFSIRGEVHSASKITALTVGVYDSKGTMNIGKTVTPNTISYNLKEVDTSIKFGLLKPGVYDYKVTVTNAEGSSVLLNQTFVVLSKAKTVNDGTYSIASAVDTKYVLSIVGDKNTNGANVHLWSQGSNVYKQFKLIYQKDGYYKVQNMGSKKYLGISSQASASGSNVEQQDGTVTLWQILPDAEGGYYFVPKCSTGCTMNLESGIANKGKNIQIIKAGLSNSNRWKLVQNGQKAKITDVKKPSALKEKSAFSIGGSISSASKITEVKVSVYDEQNNCKLKKTVNPNAASYDLNNLASAISFEKLASGFYCYEVSVIDAIGTTVLVKDVFVVLPQSKTINNNKFMIETKEKSGYVISVDGNKKTAGANLHLWTDALSVYKQFQFEYQKDGYYSIKNIGSGKFVGIHNNATASGSNVEQMDNPSYWYVIPSAVNGYYIIPKNAPTCCLNLKDGITNKGQNVQINTAAMATSQKWNLKAPMQKPSISNASKPQNMKKGSSFSITGKIVSEGKIETITVGVYDSNGKLKIGKTVSPNTTSYDLRNVDTFVKFGSLVPGCYSYKVTAKNAAGTKTLVDTIFFVLNTDKTINNGIYRFQSKQNQQYGISIEHNDKQSGANVHLWNDSDSSYKQFKFIYDKEGYYYIKNVGSGQYLSVKGQSSVSKSNIEQSSSAMRWQVIPDGCGFYYLIPACSSSSAMSIEDGKIAKGQNIRLYTYNMSNVQRWKIK